MRLLPKNPLYYRVMEKAIQFSGNTIQYTLAVSKRARRIRISVSRDGGVRLTVPERAPHQLAEQFLYDRAEWIHEQIKKFAKLPPKKIPPVPRHSYRTHRKKALAWAQERVEHFNQIYKFPYNQISIRNQSSRWGSCSSKKNLNFNYRLILLPPHLADYVIVHEICHLKELNHSPQFWDLVAHTVPRHREIKKEFRNHPISVY